MSKRKQQEKAYQRSVSRLKIKNASLGDNYRLRISKFITKMANEPTVIEDYLTSSLSRSLDSRKEKVVRKDSQDSLSAIIEKKKRNSNLEMKINSDFNTTLN